jgi:hypothetical protein
MSLLETVYARGQQDALAVFKLGGAEFTKSMPKPPSPLALADRVAKTGLTPHSVSDASDAFLQGTSQQVGAKVGAAVCTTCRKPKHYGPCSAAPKSRPAGNPHKKADFNMGMYGDDPSANDGTATSPQYNSATSSVSSLARAQEGRPADEQAASNFADLFRHGGITSLSDDARPDQLAGNQRKTAMSPSVNPYSRSEQRGSVNPYEERREVSLAPGGSGEGADQVIRRAFDQVDGAVDSTSIEGASQPSGGPPALG